tara:strand:+ start:7497 stop:8024 length:528 start_codon:yes stop_codon:yes gene_type:complete
MTTKALFLDRDGVINQDLGHVHRISDIIFIDNIFKLTKIAQDKNYLIIVITNQAGIARGKYTEGEFLELSAWIKDKFFEKGVNLTKTYYCPHHPDFGNQKYKKVCLCRKPGSLLFNQAKEDFNIDMKASMMIGDKLSDLEAAKNAGVGKLLLFSNNLNDEFETIPSLSAAMERLS